MDRRLFLNNKGFSLLEMVIASGLTVAVMTAMAAFLAQQQKVMGNANQRVEAYSLETAMSRAVSDVRSCNCIFNAANVGMATGGVFRVNLVGLKGSGSTSNRSIGLNNFTSVAVDTAAGGCDFTKRRVIAEPGEYYGSPNNKLLVRDMGIYNLTYVGDKSVGQVRGTIKVNFESQDPTTKKVLAANHLDSADAEVVFYVDPATGIFTSCDPSDTIKAHYDVKETNFRDTQDTELDALYNTPGEEFKAANEALLTDTQASSVQEAETNYNRISTEASGEFSDLTFQ